MKYRKIVRIKQDVLTFSILPIGNWDYFRDLFGLNLQFNEAHYIDGDVYLLEEELRKLRDYLKRNYSKVDQIFDIIEKHNKDFVEFCEENRDSKEIKKTIASFLEEYKKQGAIGFAMLGTEPVIHEKIEEMLNNRLNKKIDRKEFEKIMLSLSAGTKESHTLKERKSLLNIAQKIEKSTNKDPLIEDHLKNFSWLKTKFLKHTPYTKEDIENRIKEIKNPSKDLKKIKESRKKAQEEILKIKNELDLDRNSRNLIKDLQKITFLRTARIESINLGTFYISEMLKAFLGDEFEDVAYMLPTELTKFLETKEKPPDIDKRKEAYALIAKNRDLKILVGEEISKIKKKYEKDFEKNTVSGMIASRGVAQGFVRILKDETEIEKIKKGDILVTEMTTPDFVMAMEKASAIVTDLGGLTSHSAIVSRELGIPCIVGTDNATKLLKDGDFVVVDAQEKGEVTKASIPKSRAENLLH